MTDANYLREVRRLQTTMRLGEDGCLLRAYTDELFALLSADHARFSTIVLTTAARGLIVPQIPDDTRALATTLLDANDRLIAGDRSPLVLRPLFDRATAAASDPFAARQNQALLALTYAIALISNPRADVFYDLLRAHRRGHDGNVLDVGTIRSAWGAWYDDVVLSNEVYTVRALMPIFRLTFDAQTPGLVPGWSLEAASPGGTAVYIFRRDPVTGTLGTKIAEIDIALVGTMLEVRVQSHPPGVVDPLRIQYFVEHLSLRVYMDAYYEGRYDAVAYLVESTGARWDKVM